MLGVAIVALGGALYHLARRVPSMGLARVIGVLAYLVVTLAVFDFVLDAPK